MDWTLIVPMQLCIVNSIIFSLHNVITVTQVMWFKMYRSVFVDGFTCKMVF